MQILINEYIRLPFKNQFDFQDSYLFDFVNQDNLFLHLKNQYGEMYKYIVCPKNNNKIIGYVLIKNIKCNKHYINVFESWVFIEKIKLNK